MGDVPMPRPDVPNRESSDADVENLRREVLMLQDGMTQIREMLQTLLVNPATDGWQALVLDVALTALAAQMKVQQPSTEQVVP